MGVSVGLLIKATLKRRLFRLPLAVRLLFGLTPNGLWCLGCFREAPQQEGLHLGTFAAADHPQQRVLLSRGATRRRWPNTSRRARWKAVGECSVTALPSTPALWVPPGSPGTVSC